MLNSKTVFILGAGASHEFGLPLGSELAQQILQVVDIEVRDNQFAGKYDRELFNAVAEESLVDETTLYRAAKRIRDGLPLRNSIDDFLEQNVSSRLLLLLGKAAIVKAIQRAEQKSSLFFDKSKRDHTIDFARVRDTWLSKLFRMLRQTEPEKLVEKIAFINFNYDRCIEHFFFYASQALFNFSPEKAADLVQKLIVVHPYGTIGKLAELDGDLSYGAESRSTYLVSRADAIKTYSEVDERLPVSKDIGSPLSEAKTLVFLGFGYHRQNMELLRGANGLAPDRIFATALNVMDRDWPALTRRIASVVSTDAAQSGLVSQRLTIADASCAQFFDQFLLSLQEL